MLGDGSQQFHCFQMLDEMLGHLNTSANIVGIAHAFSLKISRAFSSRLLIQFLVSLFALFLPATSSSSSVNEYTSNAATAILFILSSDAIRNVGQSLILVLSLKRTAPSQSIQILTSIEMLDDMLDDMLDEMLDHLNTSPRFVKFVG